MNNIKYTGVNIAAAVLILAFFFPWAASVGLSMSGFSIMSNGISPGILSYFISGMSRLYMVLAIIVPLSAAIILYQNITANKKFDKYYKLAHIIPALYLILGVVSLYFKMKPDTTGLDTYGAGLAQQVRDSAPGVTDVLGLGFYLSLAASVYVLLVGMGKVKDKEYYKPAVNASADKPVNTDQP